MQEKIFIDLENKFIGGVCKAKDWKQHFEKVKNVLEGND